MGNHRNPKIDLISPQSDVSISVQPSNKVLPPINHRNSNGTCYHADSMSGGDVLYTFFLPRNFNDDRTVAASLLDEVVKVIVDITDGVTLLPLSTGFWISPDGEWFVDRIVPVLFVVSDSPQIHSQIKAASRYICELLEQEMIFGYRMSVVEASVSHGELPFPMKKNA